VGFRIVFAGTPQFSIPTLAGLATTHELVAILTQPDRPRGRGQSFQPTAVKSWALERHIEVFTPASLTERKVREAIRALQPEFLIVVAYGLLFPQKWLELPSQVMLNLHASLLPRWRGASPIEHSLLAGDLQSGVSIQQVVKQLDAGPVYRQYPLSLHPHENQSSLYQRLSELGAQGVLDVLAAWGQIEPTPQDERFATFAPKIYAEHAAISWSQPAPVIERQIRAFEAHPGAWTLHAGRRIKILEARALNCYAMQLPGTFMQGPDETIRVATSQGFLSVQRLKPEGSRDMTPAQWLNGLQSGQPSRFHPIP
jgi:methionyl-tRNA formyltransferase